MRITSEAKAATRERVLEAAVRLFTQRGFDSTTTRDIAREARIATGTLFNYFATKEAIVLTLGAEALSRAVADFEQRRREQAGLDEDLFAHVAAGLRRLKPYRKFLWPALETAFSPASATRGDEAAAALRMAHLDCVGGLLLEHAIDASSPIPLQLYWTLYTGVLSYWAADRSPKQEDTLALLDQSIAMYETWLRRGGSDPEPRNDGADCEIPNSHQGDV